MEIGGQGLLNWFIGFCCVGDWRLECWLLVVGLLICYIYFVVVNYELWFEVIVDIGWRVLLLECWLLPCCLAALLFIVAQVSVYFGILKIINEYNYMEIRDQGLLNWFIGFCCVRDWSVGYWLLICYIYVVVDMLLAYELVSWVAVLYELVYFSDFILYIYIISEKYWFDLVM